MPKTPTARSCEMHVEGPFPIETTPNAEGKREITSQDASNFWKQDDTHALRFKQGCYIFSTRAGKGYRPWYIGKAGAKKGLFQEAFSGGKRQHYNEVLRSGRKGTPVMFFIVARRSSKYKIPRQTLGDIERELIQYAVAKNANIRNIQNTRNLPQWSIKGVIRSGRGRRARLDDKFRSMMGIK